MNWNTLYIEGKSGFDSEVLKNLEHSDFNFMKGTSQESEVCLYWVDEKASLRDFKMAIGSKTIFKYRLRFYTTIEDLIESRPRIEDDKNDISDIESIIATKGGRLLMANG